jgi:hypothetical protein
MIGAAAALDAPQLKRDPLGGRENELRLCRQHGEGRLAMITADRRATDLEGGSARRRFRWHGGVGAGKRPSNMRLKLPGVLVLTEAVVLSAGRLAGIVHHRCAGGPGPAA